MNSEAESDLPLAQETSLQEGVDYYLEDGLLVFTDTFLRKRGYCCKSGCRHCPYEDDLRTESHQ
ncbi:MAG: DUF5522 domain-containing protein [Pyrinomonadaceae bacterium]